MRAKRIEEMVKDFTATIPGITFTPRWLTIAINRYCAFIGDLLRTDERLVRITLNKMVHAGSIEVTMVIHIDADGEQSFFSKSEEPAEQTVKDF